jgi:hypothetical protein
MEIFINLFMFCGLAFILWLGFVFLLVFLAQFPIIGFLPKIILWVMGKRR